MGSPAAVRAFSGLFASQMPRVLDCTLWPTEKDADTLVGVAGPRSWFTRKLLPVRYRPATVTTAARVCAAGWVAQQRIGMEDAGWLR
jgi:hypothetical protein